LSLLIGERYHPWYHFNKIIASVKSRIRRSCSLFLGVRLACWCGVVRACQRDGKLADIKEMILARQILSPVYPFEDKLILLDLDLT
jgi:hypothetical protein